MSLMRPRNRIVYFRLSEEEFNKLSQMCSTADGARNVSELSRSAVQKLILNQPSGSNGEVYEVLNRMQTTVSELNRKVEYLVAKSSVLAGQQASADEENKTGENPCDTETRKREKG